MKIVIITQEDLFVIPQNIAKVLSLDGVDVPLIAVVSAGGSLVNKKSFFLRGFGGLQSLRMGLKLVAARIADGVNRASSGRILTERSVRGVAAAHRIPFLNIGNPNDESFLARLRDISPDLVLSFSAPCVFGPALLSLPRHGCVNLHCSYLPEYAGLLPSFWALYHNAKETGATVHYMDDRIDNGSILAQARVPIYPGTSMFELIHKTKGVGGDLVVGVIRSLQQGKLQSYPNVAKPDQYFSWPSVEQMKDFRRRGGRLV